MKNDSTYAIEIKYHRYPFTNQYKSRPDTFLDPISGGHNFQGPLSTWVFEYFGQIFVLFEIFELFEYLIE